MHKELNEIKTLIGSVVKKYSRLQEYPEDDMLILEQAISDALYKYEEFDYEQAAIDARDDAIIGAKEFRDAQ